MNHAYDRGLHFYRAKRYDLAAPAFRRHLATCPDHPDSHAMLGLCILYLGDRDAALDEVNEALRLAPDQAFPHYAVAIIHYDGQKAVEGRTIDIVERSLSTAIHLDPTDPEYHYRLAAYHWDARRAAEALEIAGRGLERDPRHLGSLNIRALALSHLGRSEEADLAHKSALEIDPNCAQTHTNLGFVGMERKDYQRAAAEFREGLRLDPTSNRAMLGLKAAEAYLRLARFDPSPRPVAATPQSIGKARRIRPARVVAAIFCGVSLICLMPAEDWWEKLITNTFRLGTLCFILWAITTPKASVGRR